VKSFYICLKYDFERQHSILWVGKVCNAGSGGRLQMTAEVAILNTHGVALATDSAVTISASGEKKVYNTANKLFMLSKHHPVGIMIYNKAEYMGIDWEIIIKEYRKSIIKKEPFDKLSGYAESFINYVN
jgi:hypothetical protein